MWQEQYTFLIKKLSLANSGKRLVIKDPANTARIKMLLKLFPNAKFINVYRNPYEVFVSTKHAYEMVLQELALQDYSHIAIEENILSFYKGLMRRYFAEREYIPAGNLVEIRFEEFEKHPLQCLRKIYGELKLSNWAVAQKKFEDYIPSNAEYKKNVYIYTKPLVEKVKKHWGFAIDALRYNEPENVIG